MKINKNSWHWRLATVYSTLHPHQYRGYHGRCLLNMCEYVSYVLSGAVVAMIFGIIGATIGLMIVCSGMWWFFLYYGLVIPIAMHEGIVGGFAGMGMIIVCGIIVFLLMMLCRLWYLSMKKKITTGSLQPSFIGHVIAGWRNKVCTTVEFDD